MALRDLSTKELEILGLCLGKLGSDHVGERDEAAKRIARLATKAQIHWPALLDAVLAAAKAQKARPDSVVSGFEDIFSHLRDTQNAARAKAQSGPSAEEVARERHRRWQKFDRIEKEMRRETTMQVGTVVKAEAQTTALGGKMARVEFRPEGCEQEILVYAFGDQAERFLRFTPGTTVQIRTKPPRDPSHKPVVINLETFARAA